MKTATEPDWPGIPGHRVAAMEGMLARGWSYLSRPAWRLLAAPVLILAVPLWPLVLAVLWVEFCSLRPLPHEGPTGLGTLNKNLRRHRHANPGFPTA